MPHVGDTLVTSDSQKLESLIKLLNKEYERRKKKFIDYSGSYVEYNNNNTEKEPLMIVVLNAFESFQESFSRNQEMFDILFRDGAKYGITFIVSTSVANAVRNRVAQSFENKVCMRMADDSIYRDLLNAERGLVPAAKYSRGVATVGEDILEVQGAYICEKDKINNTIRSTAKYLQDAYKMKAPKLPVLPDICRVEDVLFEMKDLTTIPIGIEINSLEVYVYDFLANKVNLIVANYIENHMNFVYGLTKEFLLNENVQLKIIDVLGKYEGNYEKAEVFKDNFDSVITNISSELVNDGANSGKTVYMFLGIGELSDKLSEENKPIFEKIFMESNTYQNSTFVFVDDYSSIKKLQIEGWYRDCVDESNGIWLGDGAGDQMAINIETLTFDDKKISFSYMGFPVYKENHMIVKYVTDGVEEEDEK